MHRRVSSSLHVAKKISVTLLFGEKALIPLSQSILCANTFSRGTLANVRSKAMNVAGGDEADGASRPSDKYDKPWCKSHSRILTIAYNLTSHYSTLSSSICKRVIDDDEEGRRQRCCHCICVLELTPTCDSIAIWENKTSAPKKNHCYPSFLSLRNAHHHLHFCSTRFPNLVSQSDMNHITEERIAFCI